jgi:hypothetical protein
MLSTRLSTSVVGLVLLFLSIAVLGSLRERKRA